MTKLNEFGGVEGFDHVGVAVSDMSSVVENYRLLGSEVEHREEIRGMRVTFISHKIELLEPLEDDTPVAKFIENHGGGLHHVAFEVDDIDSSLNHLEGKVRLIDREPREGAWNKKIGFVHPSAFGGVLVEFCEHL